MLLDALHIQRGGSSLDDVRALEPDLVPIIQLCDGPLAAPAALALPAELPLGMKADGSVLQVEARVQRQVVGEGEFPLAELLAAVPPGTPISVEVPHATLQARLSAREFAAHNLRAVQALLTRTTTPSGKELLMITDEPWDDEVDLLVLGTGAGGLAAAVTGADEGLSTLVLEKTEFLGGTTAYSAGTCWIPNNRFQRADGVTDDAEVASRYLDALVGDRAPRELRESYLAHGAEMIDYLDRVGVRFWPSKKVVDYHPEIPGASLGGRALEPQTFDGRTLGKENFGRVRRPVPEFALFGGTLMVRRAEVNELLTIYQGSPRGVLTALRLGVRWAADRLRYPRGTRLAMGNALVANLFHQLLARSGRVWFTATATRLLTDGRPGRRRGRRPPGPGAAGPGAPRRRAGRRRLLRQPAVAGAVPALAHPAVHPGRGGRDRRHPRARPGRRRRAQRAARRQRVLVPQLRRPPPGRLDRGVPAHLGPGQAGHRRGQRGRPAVRRRVGVLPPVHPRDVRLAQVHARPCRPGW